MIPVSRRLVRAVLSVAAGLLLIVPAAARAPDFDFPDEVAGFSRGPRTDYEARAPGLGYSVVYTNGRWKADIYVYDAGVANIPDGASSPVVTGQLAQAAGDVRTAVAQGIYRGSEDRGGSACRGRRAPGSPAAPFPSITRPSAPPRACSASPVCAANS